MVTTTECVRNAMTVDVEDYFHADAFGAVAPHGAWSRMPCRIERTGQPRIPGLSLAAYLCHYINLGRTGARLLALTRDICWGRINEVFPVFPGVAGPISRSQLRPRWQGFTCSDAAVQPVRSRS